MTAFFRNICIMSALLPLVFCIDASAETPQVRADRRHEIRIGWGDQMFEHLVWQNPQYVIGNMPESFSKQYKEHYRYSQHWFAEYQWRVNSWFGLGAMVDASGCVWDDVTRNGLGEEISRTDNCSFWNLTMMPVLRFTWLGREYVSMYSALGAGLGINGGTETDEYGKNTLCGLAFDLTLVGITADFGRWFAFAELGGLYSLKDKATIFLFNSRIVSVGAGFRF
ncbi:MAG: hypothetical protein ACI3ZL_09425 [Candidatus Cryptobacteroides sp.]